MPLNTQTRATVAARLAVPFDAVAVLGWEHGVPVLAVPTHACPLAVRIGLRVVACDSINALSNVEGA